MTNHEDDAGYMEIVARLSGVMIESARTPGSKPIEAVMCACDVAADVLMSLPREQRISACDLFLTRLGNTLDRRSAKELS